MNVPMEEVKKSAKEDLKQLSQYEITPDDEYNTGKARRLYPKDCYKKAFEYVSLKKHIQGIKLVHGLYKPSFANNHSPHAWVEFSNEFVFDGVLQRFYKKENYYKFYEIIKQKEYDYKEMYKVGLQNGGHYGPWIDYDSLVEV